MVGEKGNLGTKRCPTVQKSSIALMVIELRLSEGISERVSQ